MNRSGHQSPSMDFGLRFSVTKNSIALAAAVTHVNVVLNRVEELKAKVPVK